MLPPHLNQQPVTADLDVRRPRRRFQRPEQRDFHLDLRQFGRGNSRESWVFAARRDRTTGDVDRKRPVGLDVTDAAAQLFCTINRHEHPPAAVGQRACFCQPTVNS